MCDTQHTHQKIEYSLHICMHYIFFSKKMRPVRNGAHKAPHWKECTWIRVYSHLIINSQLHTCRLWIRTMRANESVCVCDGREIDRERETYIIIASSKMIINVYMLGEMSIFKSKVDRAKKRLYELNKIFTSIKWCISDARVPGIRVNRFQNL